MLLYLQLSLLLLSVGTISPASLDLTELDSVQYSVEIKDSPVVETEAGLPSSVRMVNKAGQRYQCSLPQMPEPDSKEVGGEETAVPDISRLLAPLEAGPCIYKTKDWWTYEVCYRRSIKQYHVENDKPVGEIMLLGRHDPGQDVWEQTNTTFLPQYYTNGTQCDLTKRPRQAQLRFVCNEAAVQELIGDIFEPQSCEYSIVIHTNKLCSVPWLRPLAEPTPMPIVCQPLLSADQMEQYNIYQEKKKIADQLAAKKKEAERTKELLASEGAGAQGGPGLDGLLSSLSDNMADNLVSEIHSLLDRAMAGEAGGGLKVIDLRDKEEKEEEKDETHNEEEEGEKKRPVKGDSSESTASEGSWDLVHHKHNPPPDPELRQLVAQRNQLWRKIHEAKKQVKKYTSHLHDTDTFIKNEKADGFNADVVERLEMQKKTIEKALSRAHDSVAELEQKGKDVSHQLVAAQNRLMRTEERDWNARLTQIRELIKAGDLHLEIHKNPFLNHIVKDYRKVTNERLKSIEDYIKVARKIVGDTFPEEDLAEISNELQIYNEFLPLETEFMDEILELSEENVETAAKFKDVVKEDIRAKFKDILKEVSEELDIPDGDVDKDEAMAEMSKTLDRLMTKIAGTGKAIDRVQKNVDGLKQIAADKAVTDEMSLKRDNKHSVKKDLSQKEEEIEDYEDVEDIEEDLEENEEDIEGLEEAEDLLDQAEAELSALEKEMKDLQSTGKKEAAADNVKVSVTNMSPGVETDEKTGEIMKKLEDNIKDKLSKLGLDTGGRPIEIKLITTQIPDGLPEGEGAEDEAQVSSDLFDNSGINKYFQMQGLLFNMMTGNVQGYEDINKQRALESNYQFSWNQNLIQDVERKINDLGGEEADQVEDSIGTVMEEVEVLEVEELVGVVPEVLDIYQGGDERQRPSSVHSNTAEVDGDQSQDSSDKDEL